MTVGRFATTVLLAVVAAVAVRADESRAYLGIVGEETKSANKGVVIRDVAPDSPAAKAGLKTGDRIIALNNDPVTSFAELSAMIVEHKPNDKLEITVIRDDKKQTVTATLAKASAVPDDGGTGKDDPRRQFRFRIPKPGEPFKFEMPQGEFTVPWPEGKETAWFGKKRPMMGIHLQPLDEGLRERLGVGDAAGMVVADVPPDSPAAKAGVQTSDVVLEVDGKQFNDARELSDYVAKKKAGESVSLRILRDGKKHEIKVALEDRSPVDSRWRFYYGPWDKPGVDRAGPGPFWAMPQKNQLDEMQNRISTLEKQVNELRRELSQLKSNPPKPNAPKGAQPSKPKGPATPALEKGKDKSSI